VGRAANRKWEQRRARYAEALKHPTLRLHDIARMLYLFGRHPKFLRKAR